MGDRDRDEDKISLFEHVKIVRDETDKRYDQRFTTIEETAKKALELSAEAKVRANAAVEKRWIIIISIIGLIISAIAVLLTLKQ